MGILTPAELEQVQMIAQRLQEESDGMEASRALNEAVEPIQLHLVKTLLSQVVWVETGQNQLAQSMQKATAYNFNRLKEVLKTFGKAKS